MAVPMREQVSQLCQDFKGWVQENVHQGIDGTGSEAGYVSKSQLREYWTHRRVATILGHREQYVDIAGILGRYLQVISILTYITDDSCRRTEYLENFYQLEIDDHSLPLDPNIDRETMPQRVLRPFHDDPAGNKAREDFFIYQWKFLPLELASSGVVIDRVHPQRALHVRHIIPITKEGELSRRSGGGARVVKVRPHEASGLSSEEYIVLKEYDKKRNNTEFMHERNTYNSIRNTTGTDVNSISQNFLRYYGCFIQGDRCVLLIEYANQGSLLDFFRKNEYLPRSEKEAQDLWHDLRHLIGGLAILHTGGQNNSRIHQDIKPANIFVSMIDSKETRFSFKFGDFGMSSVTPIAEDGNTTGHDNGGTRMYSAPELSKVDPGITSGEKTSWAADIWSFGCVLLDCGVWMTLHERGRIEFRTQRIEETISSSQSDYLRNAGYSGAFHNGVEVLPIVQRKIKEIEALGSPAAQLTCRMMEFVHNEMLQSGFAQRLNAQQLGIRFQKVLDRSTRSPIDMPLTSSQFSQYSIPSRRTSNGISVVGVGDKGNEEILRPKSPQRYITWHSDHNASGDAISSPISFDPEPSIRSPTLPPSEVSHPLTPSSNQSTVHELRRPSPSHPRMATGAIQPGINLNGDACSLNTIQSVLGWIPKHKQNRAPMLGWLEQPLRRVRGRDQCFVFDNSRSMEPHWPDVKGTADALIYILKSADPDGFELHMTNSSNSPITRKNRKGLFETGGYFDQEAPRSDIGDCHMEQVLSTILGGLVGKALAPAPKLPRLRSRQIEGVSVYVFTNGVWEGRRNGDGASKEASGVENAIKTVVDRLKAAGQMRTFLSIQFIRFGDDPNGSERLSWLDDGIEEMTGGWDIVDTTKHTGDVEKMIIGAISRYTDGG